MANVKGKHSQLKPFVKGDDPRRNTEGANKGHNKFETDFNIVCEQIAKKNNIPFSEVRQTLLLKGYSEASKGSYQFWQYIHNQLYGMATQTHEISGKDGKDLFEPSDKIKKYAEGLLNGQRKV